MSEQNIRIRRARHGKENPYFQMRRKTAQDRAISFEARGMLAYILSKPENWEVYPGDLAQKCAKGRVYRILNELIEHFYIQRTQERNDKGIITGTIYDVYENPEDNPASTSYIDTTDDEDPYPQNPDMDNPDVDLPDMDNRPLHNKEKEDKKETHTQTERVSLPDDITWSNHQWEDYRDLLTEHPVDVMQEAIDYICNTSKDNTLTPQRISSIIRGKAAPAATGDADLPTMTDAILTGMGCTGAVTDATRKEARESARQLIGVGFTNAEASEYVTWVLRKAKAEGWRASIRSLVTNGRPNEWRNRNDTQAATESRPALPQYDPSTMLEAGLIGDGNE